MNIKTQMGLLFIEATKTGVGSIQFVHKAHSVHKVQKNKTTQHHLKNCQKQLKEYFAGKRTKFFVPVILDGTAFQKKVWRELQKIHYGQTATYGEIARRIDRPKAARAVGGACNKNKIPIIIPCHRVIGSSGSLVGFAGGLSLKSKLLQLEAK